MQTETEATRRKRNSGAMTYCVRGLRMVTVWQRTINYMFAGKPNSFHKQEVWSCFLLWLFVECSRYLTLVVSGGLQCAAFVSVHSWKDP